MMFRVSHLRRALLVGNSLNCRCSSRITLNTLDSLYIQRIRIVPPCRSASFTPNPENFELIYTGKLAKNVRAIKLFTLATSVISVPLQIYVLTMSEQIVGNLVAQIFLSMCIVFQTLMPFIIHFVGKRYVIKMYHNAITDKYLMETYNLFPTIKYTTFRPEESRAPKVEVFATAIIQEKFPVFFDPEFFTDIQHYKRLLKYDLPIDFADNEEEGSEKTTSENVQDPKDKEKLN